MIQREFYMTREDGMNLYRTYSDTGLKIKQIETDVVYSEAVDVENAPFTYEEVEPSTQLEMLEDMECVEPEEEIE